MTEQSTKPARIVIQSKSFGARFEKAFFEDIEQAFLDGYRIAKTGLRSDLSMRNFRGRIGRAVMYLEGHEPEAHKPVVSATSAPEETAPVVTPKDEVSTGAVENSPVDNDTSEADAAKLAKEQEEEAELDAEIAKEEADKAAAEKKAVTAAKAKATKLANKLAKEAEKEAK